MHIGTSQEKPWNNDHHCQENEWIRTIPPDFPFHACFLAAGRAPRILVSFVFCLLSVNSERFRLVLRSIQSESIPPVNKTNSKVYPSVVKTKMSGWPGKEREGGKTSLMRSSRERPQADIFRGRWERHIRLPGRRSWNGRSLFVNADTRDTGVVLRRGRTRHGRKISADMCRFFKTLKHLGWRPCDLTTPAGQTIR